ncbi:MAG TPA: pyridoxamine 5'-phosphate oxidase family protein [Vicinamibacteria bacterium]|jgi:PPOX class probable F420-dependent enzyme
MRKNLKPEDLRDLLEGSTLAVLGTHMKDGHTLLSPVWHEYRDGGFTVVILEDDVKSRHLKRNPMASVLVAEQSSPYRGIEIRGEATVSKPADLLDTIRRVAIRYLGEERGNAYVETLGGVGLEEIRLEPGTLRAWDFKDEELLT